MGANTGQQFASGEGLYQVIAGACMQAFDARLFSSSRRQEYHGCAAERGIFSYGVHQAKTIESGHYDVGQDQVGTQATGGFNRLLSITNSMNAVLIAQQVSHILAHVSIVVGEENKFALNGLLLAG